MSSSSDMSTLETWSFRPPFDNSWISDTFFLDADAILAKALHHSISNTGATFTGEVSSSTSDTFSDLLKPETPSSHSFSTSDHETAPKRVSRNIQPPAPTGKITKRKKSRVSKRSPTTFITADPSNFRQMVQQVTGVQFATGPVPNGLVVKPEAQRPVGGGNRIQGGYILPTLDTSAMLLDHHQPAHSSLGFGPSATVAEGRDFNGYSCFPTLDSWKVM